jgi:hypothetical protein
MKKLREENKEISSVLEELEVGLGVGGNFITAHTLFLVESLPNVKKNIYLGLLLLVSPLKKKQVNFKKKKSKDEFKGAQA